jgi:hypothetical protein
VGSKNETALPEILLAAVIDRQRENLRLGMNDDAKGGSSIRI